MTKSFRLFALAAVVSFASFTPLHAEQMGTNPHPQVTQPASTSAVGSFVAAVRSYFGF